MTAIHPGALASHPGHGQIAAGAPLRWVAQGWRDFRRAPGVGLAYGLMVTAMGWLVLMLGNHPYFLAAAVSGFLLLGPILGAGLIQTSRVLAAGERPSFEASLRALQRKRVPLEHLSVVLLSIAAVWLLASTVLLTATFGPLAPTVERSLWDDALGMLSSGQWLAWTAIGGVLAVLSFSISVIAVPLILDQDASASEAMGGSLAAVIHHPLACAAWALLIVLLTAIGIATALVGLIVIYPVLGHASWHAYQALRR